MSTPDTSSAAQKKFAVLKAGTANRQARQRLGDFSGMFTTLLAVPGQQWDVHDVQHGHFPANLSAYRGFAITGSRASVNDDEPWIHQLLETIREIHARRIPLLGMCFGHQAVAKALGGAVVPSTNGWDVGVRTLTLTEQGRAQPALGRASEPLRIHMLHMDAVTRLPPGAVHLARSDHGEHEIFTLGNQTLCLQGHAEFDGDVLREAIDKLHGAGLLTRERADASRATLATPVSRDFWQGWLRAFFVQGGLAPDAAAPLAAAARR